MNGPCTEKIQETAASEIQIRLNSLADRVDSISLVLADKTSRICLPPYPVEQPKSPTQRELPDYFNELRNVINRIEDQLDNINNTISRMDI